MKLNTFFDKFELFADAPNAVQKMRELVLESAIRGKLVPQNPSDELASEQLKRIISAQSEKVRKQLVLPPVDKDAYLEVPSTWVWTRLGNTGRIFNGDSVSESGKAELAKVEVGLPFIATKDVGYGRDELAYRNGLKVPLGDSRFKIARANSVFICAEGGSAGRKIGVSDRDICFGNKLYANEVCDGIHHRYIFYVYQAPSFFKEFAARMTGIIGGIARSEFLLLPIPLPPLAEQKRIVARVDELMALCDRLEAQQQQRAEKHSVLARAAVSRFADAPTPANLDLIFHNAYAITPADLRKTILTLAVQGKLSSKTDMRKVVLGDVIELISGQHLLAHEQNDLGRGIPYLTGPSDFGPIYPNPTRWTEKPKTVAEPGDILITVKGSGVGKTNKLIAGRTAISRQLMAVRVTGADPDFVHIVLMNAADYFQFAMTGIAIPGIGRKDVLELEVELPPLAEQKRIVAKVDELMKLVDQLETQLAASSQQAEQLMNAIVAELTAA